MKNYLLYLSLIFYAITVSCKKPIGCCAPPPPEVGVYGQVNGKFWRATSIADSSSYNTIYITARTDSDMFRFKLVKNDVGTDATYQVISGPKGKLSYVLDNSVSNDIDVTYGRGEKEGHISNVWVTSKFDLTFKLATPTGDATFDSKRVVFSNSTIHYGLQN